MERAEQEVIVRRARRLLWAVRIVFYGGAAVAAALLLTGGGDESSTTVLDGRTSQGHAFKMLLRDDRPAYFWTTFDAPCGGTPWQTWWRERGSGDVPFRFKDGRLTVASSWPARFDEPGWSGRHSARLRAVLDGDRLRGTMRLDGVVWGPGAATYTCESGDVTFFARAG